MDPKTTHNSREEALIAFTLFLKEGRFLETNPLSPFARNLSYGACRLLLILEKATHSIKPKKAKERALLYLALYENWFMDTPGYATVSCWVELAKKIHPSFAKFINFTLRNLKKPIFKSKEAYPDILQKQNWPEEVYEVMNEPAQLFVRDRKEKKFLKIDRLDEYLKDDRYYVQNPTPFKLIEHLASSIVAPKTVLDLCANPGGKTIALQEFFPNAEYFVNDLKELGDLKNNFERLHIKAHYREGDALTYPEDRLFDLVVIDVPCSNTGVLHKRPEARHRLTEGKLIELRGLQIQLLEKAKRLGKQVAYMTCSILDDENLTGKNKHIIYPDIEGLDGGFLGLFI